MTVDTTEIYEAVPDTEINNSEVQNEQIIPHSKIYYEKDSFLACVCHRIHFLQR